MNLRKNQERAAEQAACRAWRPTKLGWRSCLSTPRCLPRASYFSRFPEAVAAVAGALKDALLAKLRFSASRAQARPAASTVIVAWRLMQGTCRGSPSK